MSVVEYQLLNKVINEKDFTILENNLLTKEYFPVTIKEYEYLEEYSITYNAVPDRETFISKFPDWKFIDVKEPVRALVDTIREAHTFVKACSMFSKASEIFKDDANRGVEYIQKVMINELQPSYSFTYTDIIKNKERFKEWQDKLDNKKDYFIPSGFDALDEITYGWKRKEEFALIMARTGVGKTMFAIKTAQHAWSLGYNVAFFSPEMSTNTLGYRFDSANKNYSNASLLHGDYIKGYADYLDDLSKSNDSFNVVELKDFNYDVTVPKLRNFCKSVKADILVCDGFDYITDCRARKYDSREDRMGHISQDLLISSIDLNIPVLGVIQSNRKGSDKEELDTENITGADKIGASCTRLIYLNSCGPALKVGVAKNRYGRDKASVLYQWNIDNSQFFHIPSIDDIKKEPDSVKSVEEDKNKFKSIF
jgi:hypothetical protein